MKVVTEESHHEARSSRTPTVLLKVSPLHPALVIVGSLVWYFEGGGLPLLKHIKLHGSNYIRAWTGTSRQDTGPTGHGATRTRG